MKVVILARGQGTRLAEETAVVPKPMVEIGGRPILWHLRKVYAAQRLGDFVIVLGYKSEAIKRDFREFHVLSGRLTIHRASGRAPTSRRPIVPPDV